MDKKGKTKIIIAVVLVVGIAAILAVLSVISTGGQEDSEKYEDAEVGEIKTEEDAVVSEPLAAVPFVDEIPDQTPDIDTEENTETLVEEPEPEGRYSYEEGEEESPYTVTVIGLWDLPDTFSVSARPQLAHYLQLYFYKCLGEEHLNDPYTVTILGGTGEESDGIGTVEALCAEYPDIKLEIEYDAYNMTYGISSELGDWSLAALQKIADEKDFVLDEELMNQNAAENAEEENTNISKTSEGTARE